MRPTISVFSRTIHYLQATAAAHGCVTKSCCIGTKSRLKKPQYCKYLPPKLNHGLRVEGNLKGIRENYIQPCLKRQLPLGKTHRQLTQKLWSRTEEIIFVTNETLKLRILPSFGVTTKLLDGKVLFSYLK